jgi:glycosyltransferase involved in cell wall biosynthesis
VLHVIKGLGPGGAERLLVSLAGARSPDVDIEVAYLLPEKSHLASELEASGAVVHLLSGRRGLADLRWPRRLVELVRERAYDVVHLHSPAVAAIARVAMRLGRLRPVVASTEHNVWRAFAPMTRLANGLTLGMDDLRLAVSEEVRSSTWPRWRDDIDVVIQGIPVQVLRHRRAERAAARRRLGLSDRDLLAATVANFREKKDYPTLLRAARACADRPQMSFVSIGQGPLQAELQAEHARLGLGDRFRFLGYVPDPAAVVVAADVFVLTSRHEGLPISLLEAMALGVPPVATAVGGIPEVVTDGVDGVLVAPGDPEAVAGALRGLVDDPARRRALGERASARAGAFDISGTQAELEARYRAALAARG